MQQNKNSEGKEIDLVIENKLLRNQNTELIKQLKNFEEHFGKISEERVRELISSLENNINEKINTFIDIQKHTNIAIGDLENKFESLLAEEKNILSQIKNNNSYSKEYSVLRNRITALENSTKYQLGSFIVNSIKKPWRLPIEVNTFIKFSINKTKKKLNIKNNKYNSNNYEIIAIKKITWESFSKENKLITKIETDEEIIKTIRILQEFSTEVYIVGLCLLLEEVKNKQNLITILIDEVKKKYSNIFEEQKNLINCMDLLSKQNKKEALTLALKTYNNGNKNDLIKFIILSSLHGQLLSKKENEILKNMIEQNDLPLHVYTYQTLLSIKNINNLVSLLKFEELNRENIEILIRAVANTYINNPKIVNEILKKLVDYPYEIHINSEIVNRINSIYKKNFHWLCIFVRWMNQLGNKQEIELLLNELPINNRIKLLIYLSKVTFETGKNLDSLYFAEKAYELDSKNKEVIRRLISVHHRMGNITQRYKLINELKLLSGRIYKNEFEMSQDELNLLHNEWSWNGRKLNVTKGDEIIHVLNKSWDITTNGYTVRSEQIINMQYCRGQKPIVVTKLGWPITEGKDSIEHVIKGEIEFFHLYGEDRNVQLNKVPMSEYFQKYADVFAEFIEKRNPKIIHAASNFQNALPALAVAKSAGIKSVYEVRGMWHHTQSSKTEGFENSDRFRLHEKYEILCCQLADRVVAICESLKQHLVELGIDPFKIEVIPNGINPNNTIAQTKDLEIMNKYNLEGKIVLGFIGSITPYEGLDYLFHALAQLKKHSEKNYVMLLVGDGEATESLKRLANELNINDIVFFIGRVPHEEVSKYYSVIDIIPFPRTKAKVCQLVTPLKPYEAMEMEKTVLVSNIPALQEMVIDGETGLIFEAENIDSLIKCILEAENKLYLGKQAKKWVEENRNWGKLIDKYFAVY